MSINPRPNRLMADHKKLCALAERSPVVRILDTKGDPPTQYELLLTCKGISRLSAGKPIYSESHKLQIVLPSDYPRSSPELKMLTSVFHPNIHFGSGTVCIGNAGDRGYVPSMGLDDLVLHIIQIIRYENWNRYSAYNSDAGSWAQAHSYIFPLDKRQIVGGGMEKVMTASTSSRHEILNAKTANGREKGEDLDIFRAFRSSRSKKHLCCEVISSVRPPPNCFGRDRDKYY